MLSGGALGEIGASATVAVLVGLVYVLMAIGVGVGAISPAFGARFLNAEDAEELREQQQSLVSSAIAMLALGLMLAVLAVSGAGGRVSAETGMIAAAILLVVGVFFSHRSMKFADELMKAVNLESASVGYYLTFFVLGGWAALAHLELVPAPEMIDILSLFWALGLFAAFWATGKRGMLSPR